VRVSLLLCLVTVLVTSHCGLSHRYLIRLVLSRIGAACVLCLDYDCYRVFLCSYNIPEYFIVWIYLPGSRSTVLKFVLLLLLRVVSALPVV
jgi:hypothetical protein